MSFLSKRIGTGPIPGTLIFDPRANGAFRRSPTVISTFWNSKTLVNYDAMVDEHYPRASVKQVRLGNRLAENIGAIMCLRWTSIAICVFALTCAPSTATPFHRPQLDLSFASNGNVMEAKQWKRKSADGYRNLMQALLWDGLNRATATGCSGTVTDASRGRLSGIRNFNANGSLVSRTNFTLDAVGRVKSSQQQDGTSAPLVVQYTYYTDDSRASLIYPSGRTITTCYDEHSRPLWLSKSLAESMCLVGSTPDANFRYAAVSEFHPQGAPKTMTLGNGLVETQEFNSRLQATGISAGNLFSVTYGYGGAQNNGNVLSQTITRGAASFLQNYTYDEVNRLKTGSEIGNWAQTYVYDHRGNRAILMGSLIPNSADTPQVATDSGAAVAGLFPNNQWTPGTSNTYDAAGNWVGDSLGKVLTYDAENRLIQASVPGVGGPVVTSFVYDGQGRRIAKRVGTAETRYLYDATGSLLQEMGLAEGTAVGTNYLTQDSLGSTRLVTDETGTSSKECFDYFPFGQEIGKVLGNRPNCYQDVVYPSVSAAGRVEQRFTGKERDAETGLDYFLARYYSAAQGRFTSPDEWAGGIVDPFTGQQVGKPGPLPYADITDPQTINKYAYVRNNPLRYTDPDGHVIDTLADIAFIGYDIYDIAKNGATVTSVLALGADVVGAVVPFATGLGAGVRAGREGVVLTVKAKEGWSAAQKAEAAAKIEALNKTEMVVTKSERSATSAASRYKKAGGKVESAVQDVDHVHDLQLGGKDAVGNMKPLEKSVNRSLGPQIQNEIKRKGLKEGDKVCRIDLCQ